jgi:hypothetical protein
MAQLQLSFNNNSLNSGNVVIYQDFGVQGAEPLAWYSQYVNPQAMASYRWDPNSFDFFWSMTGQVARGVVIQAAQAQRADLTSTNQITLSNNGSLSFQGQTAGQQGKFTIIADASVPMNAAAVGIRIGGQPAVAVQARPNMTLQISPNSTYLVTFAANIERGQIFRPTLEPARVDFPSNGGSFTVTLDGYNNWAISGG